MKRTPGTNHYPGRLQGHNIVLTQALCSGLFSWKSVINAAGGGISRAPQLFRDFLLRQQNLPTAINHEQGGPRVMRVKVTLCDWISPGLTPAPQAIQSLRGTSALPATFLLRTSLGLSELHPGPSRSLADRDYVSWALRPCSLAASTGHTSCHRSAGLRPQSGPFDTASLLGSLRPVSRSIRYLSPLLPL